MVVTGGESSSFNLIKKVAYNIISFVGMSERVLSAGKRTTPYLNKIYKNLPASFCFLIEFTLLNSDQ